MKNPFDWLLTKQGKTFMAFLYGWGASAVIVGALFKIQHWPGAGLMLTIGLLTEAVIFFFSAFETPHSEFDWGLVYPELAHVWAGEELEELEEGESLEIEGSAIIGVDDATLTEQLDRMLEEAKIGPELIQSLGRGLKSLDTTTSNLADISDASVATNEYVQNVNSASRAVSELSNSYGSAKDLIASSADDLSNSFTSAKSSISESNSRLREAYDAAASSLNALVIADGEESMGAKAAKVASSLESLNNIYELQIQSSNEYQESTSRLTQGISDLVTNLNDSVSDTKRYKEEIASLGENLSSLNTVYGNMLSAMNYSRPSSGGSLE
ncbi:MAG: gliding motility protein GldL [Bacteroidetes bacterium]|nr:gliding motility protein GldL [Bacteroidota bacterium]